MSMLTHVVVFRWRDEVTTREIEQVALGLDALSREIGEIASLEHGSDLGFRDTNGDFVLIARFADRAGWDAYQAHPSHKALLADHILPIQASRTAIQIAPPKIADPASDKRA